MAHRPFAPALVAGAVLFATQAAAAASAELPSGTFAVAGVRLFDGSATQPKTTVLVREGRIAAVGPDVAVPDGVPVVDGAGRTLLPGLIDAHTHSWGDALERALAFGVTTQIDMFTEAGWAREVRSLQREDGRPGAADLVSAGILVTAPGGHGTQYGVPIPTLERPQDAAAFVDARLAEGSDFLKIVFEDGSAFGRTMPTLSVETARAVAAAAHARQRLAVAHVSTGAGAEAMIGAGVDGLVHLFTDTPPGDGLAAQARAAGIFVVPTLTVLESILAKNGGALAGDPELGPYLTLAQKQGLRRTFPGHATEGASLEHALESVRRLERAGVPVLAGTDAPNPGTTHGASMHRELALLVAAGLTPEQALAAATSRPARAFRLDDRGRIAPGLRADLLLVDGDPTADVTRTRAIAGVWKAGVPLRRERLDAVEQAAAPVVAATRIASFDGGTLVAEFGAGWQATTDQMRGGASQVTLEVVPAEGRGHVLAVAGEVRPGFAFPWAGAMFWPGAQPMQAVDVSARKGIAFKARGDGGTYRLMVFASQLGPIPAQATFTAGEAWEDRLVTFASLGVDGSDLVGVTFAGGPAPGPFRFEIDEVALAEAEAP